MNDDAELHALVRRTARQFADTRVRPIADELDRSERFPDDLYREMAQLGLFGVTLTQNHGGAGADCVAYAIVMEELSRGYASVADQCGLVELVATLLAEHGNTAQQQRYLVPLLQAQRRPAYAITESGAGSDVSGIRTAATRTASGWRLEGSKLWIHNAPVADFAVVLARTDAEAGKRGMSIFLVDFDRPGVRAGAREHKMGQRASPVGALYFDGVDLPDDALLGPENRGFHLMMSVLDKGRVGIGALAVGILQAALECSVAQANSRHQFGHAIAGFQAVQWMIADMAKSLHAARLLVRDAAQTLDRGERATLAASIAKCFASDAAVEHTSNAVQIHGGMGYVQGVEVERLYRDAKITQIYEGTNQIQRLIIARNVLGAAPEH